tara:strand:+ start:307 stop:426 length:120 start_codon:yes stop_codon:yes gene_type:complete
MGRSQKVLIDTISSRDDLIGQQILSVQIVDLEILWHHFL